MCIPQGTYFAWVDVAPYLKGAARKDLDSYLVQTAGILIESGPEGEPTFGPGGETRLRINTASPVPCWRKGCGVCAKPWAASIPGTSWRISPT